MDERETKAVVVLLPDGAAAAGTFVLHEDADAVRLELNLEGRSFIADSVYGYFDAMSSIRSMIEPDGHRLLCFGASKHVHPSGMSASMGTGDKAFRLTIGKRASMSDLLDIFDADDSVVPATLQEQRDYLEEWLRSVSWLDSNR
jgi:hypothetical protein